MVLGLGFEFIFKYVIGFFETLVYLTMHLSLNSSNIIFNAAIEPWGTGLHTLLRVKDSF